MKWLLVIPSGVSIKADRPEQQGISTGGKTLIN
jgi:hypothetical protein